MPAEYDIVETFEITGRGAVVVIDAVSDRSGGRAYPIEVLTPGGVVIPAQAYREQPLRRQPGPVENEAYMLVGLHKNDIPAGSRLRFVG